jgi:hypothetical protein
MWDIGITSDKLTRPLQSLRRRAVRYCIKCGRKSNSYWGRAVVQAVSRRLPTTAARVRTQVSSWWIYGEQSGTGAGFPRILRLPCQFSFHRLFHTQHPSSGSGTIGQLVTAVPSGLTISLTPPHKTTKELNSCWEHWNRAQKPPVLWEHSNV